MTGICPASACDPDDRCGTPGGTDFTALCAVPASIASGKSLVWAAWRSRSNSCRRGLPNRRRSGVNRPPQLPGWRPAWPSWSGSSRRRPRGREAAGGAVLKGVAKEKPRKPGRKSCDAYGRKAHRPLPERKPDAVIDMPLPRKRPDGGGEVHQEQAHRRFQPEIPRVPTVRWFQTHLGRRWDELLTFPRQPDIEGTNCLTEQAIRPAVVNRKVFGGNRTRAGAHAQGVLSTLFGTCVQWKQDTLAFLSNLLCTPRAAALSFPPTDRRDRETDTARLTDLPDASYPAERECYTGDPRAGNGFGRPPGVLGHTGDCPSTVPDGAVLSRRRSEIPCGNCSISLPANILRVNRTADTACCGCGCR